MIHIHSDLLVPPSGRLASTDALFLVIFFPKKFWMCFLKVIHSIGHTSALIGLIDMKQERSASVGCWVNHCRMWSWPLTSPIILNLEFFKVEFRNSCISGIVGLKDKKQKGSKSIYVLGWLHDLAIWPHPLPWPWNFKVRVWRSLISGMGRLIDKLTWHKGDVNHPFLTMTLTFVWPWWGG